MKKKGLTYKVLVLIIVLIVIIGGSIALVCRNMVKNLYMERENEKLQQLVRMTADNIDGDKIIQYYETNETDDYYFICRNYMDSLTKQVDDIGFMFVLVPEEDRFVYIMDSPGPRFTEDDRAALGDTYEYRGTERDNLVPLFKAGLPSEKMIVGEIDEEYKVNPITAYAPVKNSKGETVAMVEGDMTIIHIRENMRKPVSAILLVLLAGLVLLLVILLFVMDRVIASPIKKLTEYVSSYKNGKFEGERLNYKGDDEIKWLQDSFEDMDRKISDYINELTVMTAEKERIGAELNVATNIQADMLPSIFPAFPDNEHFDIYASMNPAKEVGGDFYDFFMIDEDHLGMVIADVSGKGVPAALFMVIAKTLIKSEAANKISPKEIFSKVNLKLCENNKENLFVTAWIGIIDLKTGVMTCANAGHEYPVLRKNGEEFELIHDKHGLALAAMDMSVYKEYELQLAAGDMLFVYTDGVPEATNKDNKLFTEERMLNALKGEKIEMCSDALAVVRKAVDDFVGEAPQFDDITMLCFEYKG